MNVPAMSIPMHLYRRHKYSLTAVAAAVILLVIVLLPLLEIAGRALFGQGISGSINYVRSAEGVTTATIDLEHQDIEEYYNGYANSTLWPLFHYRIDLTKYEREFGKGYERVNERFAESVKAARGDDFDRFALKIFG